jgi:hypothetical protein
MSSVSFYSFTESQLAIINGTDKNEQLKYATDRVTAAAFSMNIYKPIYAMNLAIGKFGY